MLFKSLEEIAAIDDARTQEVANTATLHDVLGNVDKDGVQSSLKLRTGPQRIHEARTNVALLCVTVEDYMMIRADERKEHKLQTKWRGAMLMRNAKSPLQCSV